jgi:hypothetical protein
MKYGVEMSSGGMIYIPSFITIGSGIQKLMGGRHGSRKPIPNFILFFFNIRKVGKKWRKGRKISITPAPYIDCFNLVM